VILVLIALLPIVAAAEEPPVDQEYISKLMTDLRSQNFGVALKAQEALIEIGEPSIPHLRILLSRTQDRWEKMKVIAVLGGIGSEAAVRALLSVIGDPEPSVRDAVVSAAKNLDPEQAQAAAPLFVEHLVSDRKEARDTAGEALQAMGITKARLADILTETIVDASGSRRRNALLELGKLGSEAAHAVPQLLPLVEAAEFEEALQILEALSRIGSPTILTRAVELVEPMILSEDWAVRQEAIRVMQQLGLDGEPMIAPAVKLLASGDEAEQFFGIDILAHIGISQGAAVNQLAEVLADSSHGHALRWKAFKALQSLYSQMEYHIGRGFTAVTTDEGVYLGWRLLGTDPFDLGFNIYRDGVKLNESPIKTSTNYLDPDGSPDARYVLAVVDHEGETVAAETAPWQQNYHTIPLQRPPGGRTPNGEDYQYWANDASAADLDGDGEYEIILKWEPSNAKDNSIRGYTGTVFIDAYKLDGTLMWRIDMGRNIRAGAHYTQFIAYDLDGDGQAEVAVKTADGTVDGTGQVIGNPNADYRNSQGLILSGPEYLTIFDGETGAALVTIDYEPPRGSVTSWGDNYGNRSDRFLAGVAYLDGSRPSLIMSRGYYTRTVIVAYNWRDGELTKLWTFDTNQPGLSGYAGQGNHQLSIADVDGDGRDEIVFGAMTVDNDGRPLYNTGFGHGDALHVGDFDPRRPGLEVFGVHENRPHPSGINFRDAGTGEVIWGVRTEYDVGRGLIADIDPNYPGAEAWATGTSGNVRCADGETLTIARPSVNFAIWWDDDLLRELLDDITITKWDWNTRQIVQLLYAQGCASNNDTKKTPALTADLFGDWREEVVFRANGNRELRVYTTTDLSEHRIYTLMHDRQYRVAVAWQNVAYNQPPHPSFYIGPDQPPPTYNPGFIHNAIQQYGEEFQ
jgi:rhamnogalacturonan endolyase